MIRASSHAHRIAIVSDSTRATTMFPPLPCESANPKTVTLKPFAYSAVAYAPSVKNIAWPNESSPT